MINPKIQSLMADFKRDNPGFSRMRDESVFAALCAKYMFFCNPLLTPFTEEQFACCIPDGSRDGGVDAMFADPETDSNRVVVFQCKYYSETNGLNERTVRKELDKLIRTIKSLRKGDRHSYSRKLRETFDSAHADFDSMADVRYAIVFATSWDPTTAEKRRQLANVCRSYCDDRYSVSMSFGADILEAAESCGNAEDFVAKGELQLYGRKSELKYGDSSVVNISAVSLGRLAKKERALLGLNLRYHVSARAIDKNVDKGIAETIQRHPDDFWYYNNGIVIVCSGYTITGKKLTLRKFSIVNGGQTTHNIRTYFATEQGLRADFPVMCKIVKARGGSRKAKEDFCAKIAEYTNSQKPIKISDLKANLSEHKKLANKLERVGVYYQRKAGMLQRSTVPRYMVANMDRLAKIGLAGILISPGLSRSGFGVAYENPLCYESIFRRKVEPQVFADLLILSRRYQQFVYKTRQLRRRDVWFDIENDEGALINNAETFVLSSIAFLRKLECHALAISAYKHARGMNDQEEFWKVLRGLSGYDSIFDGCEDESKFDPLFKAICKIIFKGFAAAQRELGKGIQPSNFFKRDANFHAYITDELWSRYKKPSSGLRLAYDGCLKG